MKKVFLSFVAFLLCVGVYSSTNLVKASDLPEISNVNVSARVEGTVVTWVTSVPASSIVNYTDRVTLAESSKIDDVLTTDHSILLSGLANSRSYQYSVSGKDVNGRLISSDDQRFTTLASSVTGDDIPYMSYVKATPGTNDILVTWNTSVPASSIVRYVDLFQDTPSSKIDNSLANDSLVTNHSILISGLPSLRSYKIYVSSKDANEYLMSTSFDGTIVKTLPSLSSPVDLTVTAITFSGSKEGENGTLSVTVKNLGGDLTSSQGLLNWYNNFSKQNFIFSSETPSILAYRGSRPDPTVSNPLEKDESITFSWVGKFNTSGNLYLQFTVDNANELDESNESNNTFSKSIVINDSTVTSTPNITIANFKYSNINNDQNVSTQIEFDLINAGNSSATFNFSSWNDTTNFPLKSGLYTLAANKTTHVYLMDTKNISHLALGVNNINVNILSLDSATIYNSQNFEVIRENKKTNQSSAATTTFSDQANSLNNSKINQLLAEINSLKNTIAEQANQIKYLSKLVKGTNISTDAQNTLNNFITYGSDDNTKKLGAGERAAVISSYKNAFDKLPTTESELTDVIKIANGRWPSVTSTDAEAQAKIQFKKVYQREADMSNANDNAAVTVMAYGLRQKAENRNLSSEAKGIKTFKVIYGHTPNTTEEWNVMQAVTYSGASR